MKTKYKKIKNKRKIVIKINKKKDWLILPVYGNHTPVKEMELELPSTVFNSRILSVVRERIAGGGTKEVVKGVVGGTREVEE